MKSKVDEESQRILLLIKLDSESLLNRILEREKEYLFAFGLKRTRVHFADIFENRYSKTSIEQLCHCSQETIIAADSFYNKVEKIYWYFKHTEDMPNTLEDNMLHFRRELKKLHSMLKLYLEADLGVDSETESEKAQNSLPETTEVPPGEMPSSPEFSTSYDLNQSENEGPGESFDS